MILTLISNIAKHWWKKLEFINKWKKCCIVTILERITNLIYWIISDDTL